MTIVSDERTSLPRFVLYDQVQPVRYPRTKGDGARNNRLHCALLGPGDELI